MKDILHKLRETEEFKVNPFILIEEQADHSHMNIFEDLIEDGDIGLFVKSNIDIRINQSLNILFKEHSITDRNEVHFTLKKVSTHPLMTSDNLTPYTSALCLFSMSSNAEIFDKLKPFKEKFEGNSYVLYYLTNSSLYEKIIEITN